MAATMHPVALDPVVEPRKKPVHRPIADVAVPAGPAGTADVRLTSRSAPAAVTDGAHAGVEAGEADRALLAIRSIVRALRMNTRAMELCSGMSLAQIFVLQELAARPVHSLNDLARRTSTHQSSVSVVVRRLVERGLLARHSSTGDRRRIEIAITDAGRELLARTPTTVQAQLVGGLAQMEAERQRSLAELLEEWLSHAEVALVSTADLDGADA